MPDEIKLCIVRHLPFFENVRLRATSTTFRQLDRVPILGLEMYLYSINYSRHKYFSNVKDRIRLSFDDANATAFEMLFDNRHMNEICRILDNDCSNWRICFISPEIRYKLMDSTEFYASSYCTSKVVNLLIDNLTVIPQRLLACCILYLDDVQLIKKLIADSRMKGWICFPAFQQYFNRCTNNIIVKLIEDSLLIRHGADQP